MTEDYTKARKLGQKEYQKAVSSGDYPYLPALLNIEPDSSNLSEYPLGLIELPINLVVGTKTQGRTMAFARNYMPILEANSEFAVKWSNLYDSQIEEGIREPIKVYEYMHRFYVQEGNKRVSVSKFVGSPTILGDVTRLVPKYKDTPESRIYQEFMNFYRVCPLYEIEFSEEGSYKRFCDYIGKDMIKPWSDNEISATRSAYQIFERAYLQKSKGRINITTGDAFLVYLSIYPIDKIKETGPQQLSQRIVKIWNELLITENDESINISDEPEEKKPDITFKKLIMQMSFSQDKPLNVAFFYEKKASESPWIYGHELGRNYIENAFDGKVRTHLYDECTSDEKLAEAIDDAVAQGVEMCFTVSPRQMPGTLRSSFHYPKTKFLNCSINLSHSTVRTYYGRMYEAKFLLGALGATMAKDNKIGYLASYPIYGQVSEINAFATGAALINPDIKIHLKWSCVKDCNWKKEFRDEGIDLVSGPELIMPNKASREYGLFRVRPDDTTENIAFPVWNWGKYYESIIQEYMDGEWNDTEQDKGLNYFWGMSSGLIDIILSGHLSYYSKKLVDSLRTVLINGILNPFDGEVHSQDSLVKVDGQPSLTYEEIVSMSWLNDNVEGRLPEKDEIKEEALDTISVSGILDNYL